MSTLNIFKELNFTYSDFKRKEHSLEYKSNLGTINFVELKGVTDIEFDNNFYSSHREIWNENKSEIFVAIKKSEILICDSKTKPDSLDPIRTAKIKSFGYGDNTAEAKHYLELLKKESIDSGYFWEKFYNFIRNRIRERKRQPIDDDLLENLKEKREKIVELLKSFANKDEIAQKLIDRCLFIRFLEDRIERDMLKDLLGEKDLEGLLNLFDYYNDCLNGDLFEKADIPADIDSRILDELNGIFGKYYTYMGGQRALIPYQFDKIPILLISHVYEQFLNPDRRRGEGIIFTPENVVDCIIKKVFESEHTKNKVKEGNITALDPSCGSGIFLVKFFERLMEEKEKILDRSLSINEKAELLQESIYGIDTDQKALRIAAFSLYLKIFENISSDIIEVEVFNKFDKETEHFMVPGLKDYNLICRNSLFGDVFQDTRFDLILGNPPWGYKFSDDEKKEIDEKWPAVSDYQSSQCFLFKIDDWMKDDSIVGMVVNLSNFTTANALEFRKVLLEKHSINTLLNLMNIKKITFGESSEPACVLIFEKNHAKNEIEFLIPDMTQFSKLTKIIVIREDDTTEVPQVKLLDDDSFWHLCILGFNKYQKLIERIEGGGVPLSNYFERFKAGETLYSKRKHGDINTAKQKYESTKKLNANYYPLVRGFKFINPYLFTLPERYINYEDSSKFHRAVDIGLFQGHKLVITRGWPLKAFSVSDTIIFTESFGLFKLRNDQSSDYLHLFEAILNSKLAYFYLASKYLQRPEGVFTKVNLGHLKEFPIPNLEDDGVIKEIIETVSKIKDEGNIEKYQNQIDTLVFDLYDLDYYERQQIRDYYKLQKRKRKNLVNEKDMNEYVNEFVDSFSPFMEEGYVLNAECYICDFLGSLVKFNFSNEKTENNFKSSDLKKLLGIIQYAKIEEIDQKNILQERKIRIYDNNLLYLYKSNHLKDWTRIEALDDVKRELGIIYKNLPDKAS
jgi:hypothetical protein